MRASVYGLLCLCGTIDLYELISALCMDGNESGVEGGGEERYVSPPMTQHIEQPLTF